MNSFSPSEITQSYVDASIKKANRGIGKMILLAILAGMIVAFGGAATGTAVHSIENVSIVKTICGLLFPIGLCMVLLLGAELFTGNCMISIAVLEKKTTLQKMLRNWGIVYFGNFAGALMVAAFCAFFGQFDYSAGGLAVYTIKVAAGKCAITFQSGIVLGILCNILVCAAVLCSMSAKDTSGRILGAYLPVVFFVICGFEHCIANMYYIPAGLFAMSIPRYAQLAAQAGIDVSMLSWGHFLVNNLLPVTIGNILGGVGFGMLMWFGHLRQQKDPLGNRALPSGKNEPESEQLSNVSA